MYAALVKEPYNLRLHEIAQLTDQQIAEIYCRPEPEEAPPDDTPEKIMQDFLMCCSWQGLPIDQALDKWEAEKERWLGIDTGSCQQS